MADSPFHYRPNAAESAWIAPRIDALAAAVDASMREQLPTKLYQATI